MGRSNVSRNAGRIETLRYHAEFYRANELFDDGTWLRRPEPYVLDAARRLPSGRPLAVLDLGAGVGRNTIPVARMLPGGSRVTAIDILETAVERLQANCRCHGVADMVHSETAEIEGFPIEPDAYDFVFSVSALEHVASLTHMEETLLRIMAGTRAGGLNCFMINTDAREITSDGGVRDALIEFHLGFNQAHDLLNDCYVEWHIIDQSRRAWRVPESRGGEEFTLASTCLQFLARKTGSGQPGSRL